MNVLAIIVLIWAAWLLIGSIFGMLGKLIWIAILLTVICAAWRYLTR